MSLLPPNLAHRLIEGSLPWEQSTKLHISDFLKLYTLHDSNWVGLFTDCACEDTTIAVIRFDPVWNPSVSAPTSFCADWPLLLLRFACVSSIQISGYRNIDGTQRGISEVSVESISEEELRTTITDHYGGSVSVRHFPLIDALAMSPQEEERILPLGRPQASV
jgi:hypothetical protein